MANGEAEILLRHNWTRLFHNTNNYNNANVTAVQLPEWKLCHVASGSADLVLQRPERRVHFTLVNNGNNDAAIDDKHASTDDDERGTTSNDDGDFDNNHAGDHDNYLDNHLTRHDHDDLRFELLRHGFSGNASPWSRWVRCSSWHNHGAVQSAV